MAEVGEHAAEGARHVRFEVSESLSRGGAPTVLNRAGGAAAGGGADGGAGGIATGGPGTGAGGNPETRLARTPPEDHVMGEAESGDPIELLKKELADTRAELMSLRMGSVAIHNKPKYDIAKPPRFAAKQKDGDLDIRGWFALMLEYCKLTEVDPDKAASVIALYLDGRARVMYLAMLESAKVLNPDFKPTVDWLKDLLFQAYGSVDPIALAWTKLDKLKQGSSSVEEYVTNFEQVCAELGPECPNEPDKIQRFKAGLNSDIRFRCAATPFGKRWTNFQDFVRCCALNWEVMQQNKPQNKEGGSDADAPKSKGNQKPKNKPNNNSLSVQSNAASIGKKGRKPYLKKTTGKANGSGLSIPRAEMQRLMNEGRCLYCKEKGHFARDCPTNPNAKGKEASAKA